MSREITSTTAEYLPSQEVTLEKARAYASASKAANTKRAYQSDFRHFANWCRATGRGALPAQGETVALYLAHYGGQLSISTLSRRLAAINAAHRAASWAVPASPDLAAVWSGVKNVHGYSGTQAKAPITLKTLASLAQPEPGDLRSIRDRALLLVGFAGALRRSELAALNVTPPGSHVRFVAEGLDVVVRRSKTDQEGRGAVIAIPVGRSADTCAVRALRAWLDLAAISDGPVFRRIDRHGKISKRGVGGQTIAHVVKSAAASLGLDPATVSGHSLRAGLATSAAANGAPAELLMRHMRHAHFDTTARYIREAERFKRNAATIAGL
jgi:site-specific recombinase XerD